MLGLQTVAVIPVLGHGVVQLGSSLDVSHFFLFSSVFLFLGRNSFAQMLHLNEVYISSKHIL